MIKIDKIFKQVAKENNVSTEVVEQIYKRFWNFIRFKISELPLDTMSLEDFHNVQKSFVIPKLGKLGCPETTFIKIKQILNKKYAKNQKN